MHRRVSSPGSRHSQNLATPVFHTCGTPHSESTSISHLSGRNLNLENPLTRAKCYGSVRFRRFLIVLYTMKSGSSIWNTGRNASSRCSHRWPRGDVPYFNHLGHTIWIPKVSFEWSELKLCRLEFSKSGKSAMEVCMCVLTTILPAKLYVFKLGSPIGVSNWDSNWDWSEHGWFDQNR